MIRWAGLLLFTAVGVLPAADVSPTDLSNTLRASRDQAEHQLADARTRIAREQAAILTQLQQAIAIGNAARDRLTTAEREAQAAGEELTKRQCEHDRELTLVKQLADRTVLTARLGDAEAKAIAGAPPAQRVASAIFGVARRLQALPDRLRLRLADEAVIGRRGGIATVPVLRLGEARAIALGTDDAHRGLLERSADGGSWLVVGPALPVEVLPQDKKVLVVPLDAAGTAAHQSGAVHRTVTQWLAAGRFFIWPIMAALGIGLIVAIERMVVLARRRVDHRRQLQVADRLAANNTAGAKALVIDGSTPLDRVLRAGVQALGRPRESREAVVEQALLAETAALTRGLPALAVLAGVAPLLGLLGTVTGMIDMFSIIAAQGAGNAKSLSGGISEALICTQAGMMVAIPLLLAHAWLGRLADTRSQLLEEAACGVLGLSEHDEPKPEDDPSSALIQVVSP